MAAIGFKTAKCKDCYKCVRICPVKAIRIKDEHALYVADECVLCGRCLEACPQDAVVYVCDLNKAKKYIREGNVTNCVTGSGVSGHFRRYGKRHKSIAECIT